MSFEYPRNVRFVCDKCAICCGDTEKRVRTILLLNIEAQRITKETKKVIEEFARKAEGSRPYVYQMKKTNEGKCVFLRDNLCAIYETRPLICRFYPFELKTVEKNHVFSFTNECPAIGKGQRLRKNFFEKLFEESANLMSEDGKKRRRRRGT